MQVKLTSVSNPIWSNAEHTAIDCQITTTQFGDDFLPFTASQNDVEAHGRGIFADIVAGKYGTIGEYIAPPEPVEPTTETAPETTASVKIV